MNDRMEINPEELVGKTVKSVEIVEADGYVVLHFTDGSTCYGDDMSAYAPAPTPFYSDAEVNRLHELESEDD